MTRATGTFNTTYSLARARGRSIGALFLSIFGGLWLALSFFAFGALTRPVALSVALGTLTFVVFAVSFLRTVPHAAPDANRKRDNRIFVWVNAAQWAAIFAALQIANRTHHPDAAFPAIVLIVGLHFFALPRSYRHRSNLVTGAVLTLGAVLCPLFFRGDTMVGIVTAFAGVTLWISAGWALATASSLLRGTRRTAQRPVPLV